MTSFLPRLLLTSCVLAAALWAPAAAQAAEPAATSPVHQLRLYEIFDNNKQQFHDRFRDHAMRIMARHGFKIVAIWETRLAGRTEFAYLLEWPGADGLLASAQAAALSPPANLGR